MKASAFVWMVRYTTHPQVESKDPNRKQLGLTDRVAQDHETLVLNSNPSGSDVVDLMIGRFIGSPDDAVRLQLIVTLVKYLGCAAGMVQPENQHDKPTN